MKRMVRKLQSVRFWDTFKGIWAHFVCIEALKAETTYRLFEP
jgi:hypothetical protein